MRNKSKKFCQRVNSVRVNSGAKKKMARLNKRLAITVMMLLAFLALHSCFSPVAEQPIATVLHEINLTVTPADGQIMLKWEYVQNSKNYEVFIDGEMVTETTATEKVIKGLVNGKIYVIRVKAIIDEKTYLWSNRIEVKPEETLLPPQSPQLKVIIDDAQLIPTWGAVNNGISYEVYMDDVFYAETEQLSIVISGLTNDTIYNIKVIAKNAIGQSPFSNTVSVSPNAFIRFSNIGCGLNVFGPIGFPSISMLQILDTEKLNSDRAILITDQTKSIIYIATGEQMRDVLMSMNMSYAMNASAQFKMVTASSGFAAAYGSSSSQHTNEKYMNVRSEYTIGVEMLAPRFRDPHILKNYVSPSFLRALDDVRTGRMKPERFFLYYGQVLLFQHYIGGTRNLYYKYHNKKNISLSDFRMSANASIREVTKSINADKKFDFNASTSITNIDEDSEIMGETIGGNLETYMDIASFFEGQNDYVTSIYQHPVFCGLPNYANSTLPVWILAEWLGEYEVAAILHEAFVEQAFLLAKDYEERYPGEWFKMYGEEFLSSNSFYLPKQYLETDNGKIPAIVKIIIKLRSAGGGGAGHGGSKNHDFAGGGGGEGSIAWVSFMTNEDVYIQLKLGKPGRGSPANVDLSSGYARNGYPGGVGEESSVIWNGVTITCTGGMGGNHGGGTTNNGKVPNGDTLGGDGGIASITGLTNDIVANCHFKYLLRNGNPGKPGIAPYSAGAGGSGSALKGMIAAQGGRGGGASPYIHGFDGEDAMAQIQYYSYMGE